ncbi:HNH endonuclease [Streptomyces flaveus]|uniref:HNH endonuclease n=1 Tax=Streptomyces flaveus TaxID=66370 RepID=A0A917RHG6_9ACTN|nr:hypothetical protein [Streptomyces flaveus]GGL07404.1 hypothetical protein GCM10010094_80250 [Streptomyces flaveus]
MRWPLKPEITVEDVMKACTPWLTKQEWTDLIARLPELIGQEERYRAAGEVSELLALLVSEFESQPHDTDKGRLSATYDKALVGGGGRRLYNAIKATATYGCSICGAGPASTLDHHAPKAAFPLLALTPLNLVPACGPCNQGKSTSFATDPAMEPFHPYFDDLGTARWLYAEIHRVAGGAVAEFSVLPPADWPEVKAQRLVHHFTKNKLGPKFKFETPRRLASRRQRDTDTLASSGPEGLRAAILEEADSHAAFDPNDWETAWLYGLAECDWYINGGMNDI